MSTLKKRYPFHSHFLKKCVSLFKKSYINRIKRFSISSKKVFSGKKVIKIKENKCFSTHRFCTNLLEGMQDRHKSWSPDISYEKSGNWKYSFRKSFNPLFFPRARRKVLRLKCIETTFLLKKKCIIRFSLSLPIVSSFLRYC